MPSHGTANTVLVVGPMPPPVNGQAAATLAFSRELERAGHGVTRINTSSGTLNSPARRILRKFCKAIVAITAVAHGHGPVYLSVHAGWGMWLTVLVSITARARRRRQILHHHSYDYVRQRKARALALVRAAGPGATHVVLGRSMARDLKSVLPRLTGIYELDNAGLIDLDYLDLEHRPGDRIVLGHLSNLTADKGVDEVVRLGVALLRGGFDAHLVVAGPVEDKLARESIDFATRELGAAFTYMGAVAGDRKREFFGAITHFAFPTRYRNEAAPLVLLEAMASGVICIATDLGCIAEQLGELGGLAVPPNSDFVAAAMRFLDPDRNQLRDRSALEPRRQFLALRSKYQRQVTGLIATLSDE